MNDRNEYVSGVSSKKRKIIDEDSRSHDRNEYTSFGKKKKIF